MDDLIDIAKYTLPLTSKQDYSAEYLGTLFPGGDVRNPEYTIGESIARLESVFDIGDIVYEKDPCAPFPAQLMPVRVVYHDGRHDPEVRGIMADDGFTRESFVEILGTQLDLRDDEMVVIGLGFSGMGRVVGFMQPGDEAWTLRGPRFPTAFVTPKDREEYALVRFSTDDHGTSTDALVPVTNTAWRGYMNVADDTDRKTFLRALSPYLDDDTNRDTIAFMGMVRDIPENWRIADISVVDVTLASSSYREFDLPVDGRVSKYHESMSVERRVENEYAVSLAKVSNFRARSATWAYVRSELIVDIPTMTHDLRVSPDFKELVITHKSCRFRSIMLAPACLMELEDLLVMEMSPNILRCHGSVFDRLAHTSNLLAHRTHRDPHPEFKRELYAEQRDSLARMAALENLPGGIRDLTSARIPGIAEHLRYNGRYVRWNNDGQRTPAGGILADDPEYGKTTTIAALIATREPGVDTTAVIVPANLVHQWETELAACLPNQYKVHIGCPPGNPREHDVIVTTFPAFSRAYPDTEWTRVVIDESHSMTPDATRFSWKTGKLWMVTRHPLENVAGQFRAFGLPSPYSNWTRSKSLLENADIFGALSRCVIHHHGRQDPKPVGYTPVFATLTDTEIESVRGLQARRAQVTDRAMLRKIDAAISKIQAGGMVSRDVLDAGLLLADRTRILPGTEESCVICYEPHVNPSVTPCGHWFCRECISTALRRRSTCPMCRRAVTMGGITLGITESDSKTGQENGDGHVARDGDGGGKLACRSKVNEVLRVVRGLPEGERAVIVSQSADALKLVAAELEGCSGVGGSQKQRSRAFREFDRALVINTRSMCTGLDLSRANHLVIMGSVPDIDMVVDTLVRPGQTKYVRTYHILLRAPV